MRIGIMQGRLVPPTDRRIQCFPRDRWRDEFALARAAGLTAIEWIDDDHGEDVNPIATDAGLAEMRSLAEATGVAVRSVCADYFMDRPFLRSDPAAVAERVGRLVWLLGRAAALGVGRVVLPFVDASRIENDDEMNDVVRALERVLPTARDASVELHLETSLSPSRFASLLARLPRDQVYVNYDSGNSASLGYSPREEFAAYGDRVGSVHIKDRLLGGSTVPLGEGDTDFASLFDCLDRADYAGDFVLQVARGVPGDEVSWARQNIAFVQALRVASA
jgi:L-ribulose-5-phosphate 3-epimerase